MVTSPKASTLYGAVSGKIKLKERATFFNMRDPADSAWREGTANRRSAPLVKQMSSTPGFRSARQVASTCGRLAADGELTFVGQVPMCSGVKAGGSLAG